MNTYWDVTFYMPCDYGTVGKDDKVLIKNNKDVLINMKQKDIMLLDVGVKFCMQEIFEQDKESFASDDYDPAFYSEYLVTSKKIDFDDRSVRIKIEYIP